MWLTARAQEWLGANSNGTGGFAPEKHVDRLVDQLGVFARSNRCWVSTDRQQATNEILTMILQDGDPSASPRADVPLPLATEWAQEAVGHLFSPVRCHCITDDDRFGRYLGFVDVRMNTIEAPLAMGLLVPPRHIRHDSRARCIAGEYSPLSGQPVFQVLFTPCTNQGLEARDVRSRA